MGQLLSRYFRAGRSETGGSDTESLVNRGRPEDEADESCLQYLKRKVTDFFCCYDPSPKRQRLEETDQSGDMNSTEQNQPIDEESIPSIIVSDTPRLTTNQPTSIGEKEEERSGDVETNSSNFSVSTQLYLNFPFIEDSLSVNHVKNSLTMFVMRGLPGCGKSTIVKTLLEVFPKVKLPAFLIVDCQHLIMI